MGDANSPILKTQNPKLKTFSLPQGAIITGREIRLIRDGETPVAVGIRRIGEDRLPVHRRRQVGGHLQDVGIIGRAGELKL